MEYQVKLEEDGSVKVTCESLTQAIETLKALKENNLHGSVSVSNEESKPVNGTKKNYKQKFKKPERMTGADVGLTKGYRNAWEDDEIRRVYELWTNKTPRKLIYMDPALIKRHSPSAIAFIIAALNEDHYLKRSIKTVGFFRKYHKIRMEAESGIVQKGERSVKEYLKSPFLSPTEDDQLA